MNRYDDPLDRMGMTLACALLAQIASVLLAAVLASSVPGGYRVRAWVFLAGVAWTLAGTVLLVMQTVRAEPRREGSAAGTCSDEGGSSGTGDSGARAGSGRFGGRARFGPRRIALWIVSTWLWPILVRWRPRT
jgi:hypothetical protein